MPLPVRAEIPEVSESAELKSILAEDGVSVLWENGDDEGNMKKTQGDWGNSLAMSWNHLTLPMDVRCTGFLKYDSEIKYRIVAECSLESDLTIRTMCQWSLLSQFHCDEIANAQRCALRGLADGVFDKILAWGRGEYFGAVSEHAECDIFVLHDYRIVERERKDRCVVCA